MADNLAKKTKNYYFGYAKFSVQAIMYVFLLCLTYPRIAPHGIVVDVCHDYQEVQAEAARRNLNTGVGQVTWFILCMTIE